jgi:protein SCO1
VLKFLLALIVFGILAGSIARMFVPKEKRAPRMQLRKLFQQLAGVLLVVSLGALVAHWFWNRPPSDLQGAGNAVAAGGNAPSFKATDITGATFGRDFALTDHTGQKRRLADFRGKAVLLFFGYTQCPDVCPTAMQRFQAAMKLLGPQAARVQVLFVTLDPERDTRELLAQYVPWFDKSFLGLSGSPDETATVAKEFRVFYAKRKSEGGLGYTLDHWAGAYAFDPAGRLRLYLPPELSAADLAADVRQLLATAG